MKLLAAWLALGRFSSPIQRNIGFALCVWLGATGLIVPVAHGQMPSAEEMRQMQQEMEEGMRLMQEEMGKLDPATRKQIDQMMSSPPVGGSNDSAPVRDQAKIAALSTAPLTQAALKTHVEQLQPKLTAALAPTARARAEKIDAELRKAGDYLPRLRAAANGLAAWGAWPEATYLMGKAALGGGDAQDLSNLAALLTMQHAPSAALPILTTLNARYPNNSTLLNNLGQARYGLGDIGEAEKFLVAAVRITPLHPQANMTLARIQQARGDMQAAQESLHKALQGGFSKDKEEQLRKAGGTVKPDDVRWLRPMPQDPLGLHKFEPPPYPTKAMELPEAVPQWRAFNQMLRDMKKPIDQRVTQITANAAAASQGAMIGAAITLANSGFAIKAAKLMEVDNEHYRINQERLGTSIAEAMKVDAAARGKLERRVEEIDAAGEVKYRYVAGGYAYEYTCGEVLGEIDQYYAATSPVLQALSREWLDLHRRHLSEMAYLSQFTSPTPEMFEATKLSIKSGFLTLLDGPRVSLQEGLLDTRAVCFKGAKKSQSAGKLLEFDDIHCDYISTLNMPGVGTIVSRCNVTEANFEPIFAPFKASWASDVAKDRVLRASAQVSVDFVTVGGHSEFDDKGLASGGLTVGATANLAEMLDRAPLKGGPLEIGVEVGVTAGLEFDRSGLTDVSINAGVESKASSTIGKTEAASSKSAVTSGANATWSWNAGFSGDVSGGFNSSVF